EPPQTSQWINSESSVEVVLSNDHETLYSGECLIISHNEYKDHIILCLMPLKEEVQRFRPKKFRSTRVDTSPLPNIFFLHPLINKLFDLKVINLSGLGFSVKVRTPISLFLPGMILPRVKMRFANSFNICFTAQVIYKKCEKSEKGEFTKSNTYGLAFLNIGSDDHLKLLSFLHQASDSNLYISNKLDMDLLWEFFFESNFIYPEKYSFLQSNKDEIKTIYKTLYSKKSNIARHFTYQENEKIASHLAMIRYYDNTWLIHHHASNRRVSFRAGLLVLNQVGVFSNDSYGLYSNHMNYLLCYFRPENKFPNRVFGGAARAINDSMKCCLESFSYFHFKEQLKNKIEDYWEWGLTETDTADIEELHAFYEYKSCGLMLKALDLGIDSNGTDLYAAFNELGLKRNRYLFSLKYKGHLKAIIMVNISNVGLNLSDLTNATTVIVIDQEKMNGDIIKMSLSLISAQLKIDNFPVLIYPSKFVEDNSIEREKEYYLWILDTQYGDKYFNYVNRLTRLI
ncbi:MAG: PilZ domain-containing protein, partial [Thermodesulfobacteriota bacterium]